MDVLSIVEVFTQIVTFLMLASGIPPCLHMYRTKNTKNVPFIFFLLGLVNATAAVYYGILVANPSLRNINLVGVAFNLVFVVAYLSVCKSKGTPLTQTFIGAVVLVIFYWYLTNVVDSKPAVTNNLGMFLFVISSLLLASPGLEVMDCVREQSAEGLSLSMLYGGLLCSSTWLAYGLLLEDFFIYAPNIIGVSTSLAKVGVLMIYGGKKKIKKTE